MEAKFLWLILQEIDSLFLSIAVISILFFFFFVKVRFQKRASLRAYGILFYAFVFYAISAMSYVFLNAMDSFFRLTTDLYSDFWWFFPFGFLSAIIGAFIGWLVYFAGSKTAGPYVFKLMNLSLLVIAPFLLYSLLVQPVIKTLDMALKTIAPIPVKKEINAKEFQQLSFQPNEVFTPATPAQLFDSLKISVQNGNNMVIENLGNGFSYSHKMPIQPIEQLYISGIPNHKQMAVLSITPAIQGESVLMIVDSLGNLVYQKNYTNAVNRMSVSENGKYILLQREWSSDSLAFSSCLMLKSN
jgi:hypothetical protein